MSSGSYLQVYVRCPFYRSDDGKFKIVCEGVGDAYSLSLNYPEKSRFLTQMNVFCCKEYEKCEVFRMLMEKYEE